MNTKEAWQAAKAAEDAAFEAYCKADGACAPESDMKHEALGINKPAPNAAIEAVRSLTKEQLLAIVNAMPA